jgi:hypothetical protein
MARRVSIIARVRKAVRSMMKKVKVSRETDEKPSLVTSPSLLFDKGAMTVSGMSYELAAEFADDLKAILDRQLIAWVPLNKEYALRKRLLGLDPRILIATGRYVNSIQPLQQPDGSWVVGVPEEPLGAGSKYTLRDLARWLEYGTQRMPARPHWRPAKNVWRTKIYQMKRRMHFDLVRELKRQGFK